ncbi:tripartite tricarboxylate transporter substrate binding protein [Xylophilus sp.]|uniref:tripartite tricarboxylate transporter substrate binding protein n=1 Tax=Xylophilus sp. TaxID=2653893 RepID=UPI0013BDF992|nr:tripartite tricarboxylate transporter substrate binding protein [Xylophilus sp.]KAF1044482.1 MAG: hypothetical protein GAK38_03515 [Xylophilus sp.]
MKRFLSLLAALLIAAASPPAASADATTYPTRAIRIVVPFAPGSAADVTARLLAPGLSRDLGQPVVVDNRAGAAGIVGTDVGGRSAPDGYTLVLGTSNTHGLNSGIYKALPYDPLEGFVPIGRINAFANVLVVPPGLGVNSMAELIALARRPGHSLSYASAGRGTSLHLAGEMFRRSAGIELLQVSYKDTSTYVTDVLAGRVDMVFMAVPVAAAHVRAGKLKALAIIGAQRSPLLPEVPTIDETGVTGMQLPIWVGLFAPKGTPAPIALRLNAALRAAQASPDTRAALQRAGSTIESDASPADFLAFLRTDVPASIQRARDAGIEPE